MPDYAKVYLHNRYEVVLSSHTTYTFSLLPFIDNPLFDRPFAIVTAFNPHNNILSYQENLSRNKKLYIELNSKYDLLEAIGCHEGHCEEGYLIFDISFNAAIELGQKYEQYAVFYNAVSVLKYVNCENAEVIVEKER